MGNEPLQQRMEEAIWIAGNMFARGRATGSTANLSFLHNDLCYITGTGTSFGRLSEASFSMLDLSGNHLSGIKPSKEYPLHLIMYKNNANVQAVIHSHSFYSTLWSVYYNGLSPNNCIPKYTPYLEMKLGQVKLVDYAPPGSAELFHMFSSAADGRLGYLLRNHGPIVGAESPLEAFYLLEELEESAHLAWQLRQEKTKGIL